MIKTLLASLLLTSSAWALQFEIVGPCEEKAFLQKEISGSNTTLGDFTVETLKALSIPFTGDRYGISSINQSPRGDEALEVLSDSQMRAYGWCVEVDGAQPELMPDQIMISSDTKTIKWFYAYTFYDAGVWKDFCSPSWKIRSLPICGK